MRIFIEKNILVILCCLQEYHAHQSLDIVILLSCYSLSLLCDIVPSRISKYALLVAFIILIFTIPSAVTYIPLLVYCAIHLRYPWGIASAMTLVTAQSVLTPALTVLAIYLAVRTRLDTYFQERSMHTLDVLESDKLNLRRQQLQLKKDYLKNVELATLTERNRIAHRLHDTLGHLISSSILQLEALRIMSQEALVQTRLETLSDAMQEGMNDIRQTLHNLYDESFNLQTRVEQACQPLDNRHFTMQYALDSPLDLSFKIDILSIVQELVANCQKHSNATTVHLSIIEQIAFYTITYTDNGSLIHSDYHGIGLLSMQETARKYGGNLTLHTDNGFTVHITLMKERKCHNDSNHSH